MAGELWRSTAQIGVETTPGTPVAATRKVYWREPTLTKELPATPQRFATGTRDNVRAVTYGSAVAGGALSLPLSSSEALELFSIGVNGTPVITTPAMATLTRLHTYKPGDLKTATIEWDDGKRVWQGAGYMANSLTLAGAVNEENILSAELFGTNLIAGTLTGALADRTPDFLQGWQSRVYLEAFSGTPGTTVVSGFLTNWNVQIMNNLGRVYTAGNTQAANRVIAGELDVTATLTVDADSAQAITEFNNWVAGTQRMVRLEFQDETGFIETTFRKFVTIDIPGAWTAVALGESGDGVRRYGLSLQGVYQSTLAAMIQIRAQNNRTAAFA